MNEPGEDHGWAVSKSLQEQDTGDELWSFPNVLLFILLGLIFGYWTGRLAILAISPVQEKKESVR